MTVAVSYTHLDVYKRQVLTLLNPISLRNGPSASVEGGLNSPWRTFSYILLKFWENQAGCVPIMKCSNNNWHILTQIFSIQTLKRYFVWFKNMHHKMYFFKCVFFMYGSYVCKWYFAYLSFIFNAKQHII